MKVAVLDTNKKVLAPTSSRRARLLLSTGKASVLRRFPFTIILKREVEHPILPDLRLKIDPGSKTTGIAIVNQATGKVIFGAELQHRGHTIKANLESRWALRRGRRNRKTRYRKPRFLNRNPRPEGWLAPSLKSRVLNTETWAKRLSAVYPISGVSLELVRFDTQLMQNAGISGVEYQQGELQGYEVREYLLEKYNRQCCYCKAQNLPLQVEHIVPKSRGGSNRITNLCLACEKCNLKKGIQTAAEFGFPELHAKAKLPLKDAAAVNSTRWALLNTLKCNGFEVEAGSGGLTKFNRVRRGLPKTHWLDAACVGQSTPEKLDIEGLKILQIKATGRGSRQLCATDKFGFPLRHRTGNKFWAGFQTGDIVRSSKDDSVGRVTIRQRNSFILNGKDIHVKYLYRLQKFDGYGYAATNTT